MRRLWIERRKAYAACLAKMKVYIEDHEHPDTTIGDVPCRKLGELKNGQQRHFAIGDQAARVFVVADQLSRNLYNEFVRVPAGREDVFLSGQNRLKPSAGNPFHFDGVKDEDVLENRKRVSRKGSKVLIAAVIVGILAGAVIGGMVGSAILSNVPETVRLEAREIRGMQIVLPEIYEPQEMSGYAACYTGPDAAVFLLQEKFSLMQGFADLTVEEYGAMVLANNQFDQSVELRQEEGLTVFDYEYTSPEGDSFYYYTVLCKGPDAFWMVQFASPVKNAEEMVTYFRQWAKTVTFQA